jgi:hypothetical protein
MADPFQKLPAASDNVQNHTQVTEVVELDWTAIRDSCSFRYEKKILPSWLDLPSLLTIPSKVDCCGT